MKKQNIFNIVNDTIINEVKKAIIKEAEKGKEVYHIKLDGVPVETFDSEAAAKEALPKYKADKKGDLIIEKGVYDSHEDMMDEFDKMNDELDEGECNECGGNMEEDEIEETYDQEKNNYMEDINEEKMCSECGNALNEDGSCNECGYLSEEDGDDDKIGGDFDKLPDGDKKSFRPNVDLGKSFDKLKKMMKSDNEDTDKMDDDDKDVDDYTGAFVDESTVCSECGSKLNEDGVCDECAGGMNESKKKKLKINETELISLIKSMVQEATGAEPGVPGVPGLTVTKRAQVASKKENDSYTRDVEKKLKKYLSFEGNDNPEFPKPIGKGEKMAINNTESQDEEVSKNKAGLQNLDYDIEPSENFKKRLKMAIEGDSKMGNAASKEVVKSDTKETKKTTKKPGEKLANTIENPNAKKKLEKQIKNREKDKKERVLYKKEKVPVDTSKKESVNESELRDNKTLKQEINKIKNLSYYNKKTQ